MTKQTELKTLLQDLYRATFDHLDAWAATRLGASHSTRRADEAVDVAEKRVFSFFDSLNSELAASASAYKALQGQRDFIAKERDEAFTTVREVKADLQKLAQQVTEMYFGQTVPNVPFDATRARAGDAIEVVDDEGNWYERQYVGEYVSLIGVPTVVFLVDGLPKNVTAPWVRMKPTALKMFATVYRTDAGAMRGYLYDEFKPGSGGAPVAPPPGMTILAKDVRVAINC
jgi:hypothetical protein